MRHHHLHRHRHNLTATDIRNYGCVQTFNVSDHDEVSVSSLSTLDSCAVRKRLLFGSVSGVYAYDGLSAAAKSPGLSDIEPTVSALYNEHFGTFVSASGRSIKVWNVGNGFLKDVYRNCSDHVITALAFDTSQKKIIIGDAAGNIRVLNGLNGALMKESNVKHAGR